MAVNIKYHMVINLCALHKNVHFLAAGPSGALTREAVYGLRLAAVLSPRCHLKHKCLHVCSHGNSHFTQKSLAVALSLDPKLLLNHVSCRKLICFVICDCDTLEDVYLSLCMVSTWWPTVVSEMPLPAPLTHCFPPCTGT